jgi:hypothetical protein
VQTKERSAGKTSDKKRKLQLFPNIEESFGNDAAILHLDACFQNHFKDYVGTLNIDSHFYSIVCS